MWGWIYLVFMLFCMLGINKLPESDRKQRYVILGVIMVVEAVITYTYVFKGFPGCFVYFVMSDILLLLCRKLSHGANDPGKLSI